MIALYWHEPKDTTCMHFQVTSYAHGSSELLGIQIDAAINPGKYGTWFRPL